jgi:DNA-binding CsgD family transcriptional regulator
MTELDLFESLLTCQSIEGLHAAVANIVKQIGYEHFIYGVQVRTSLTRPYQFVFSGYPKEWRDHYVEVGYQNIDPTVAHCIKNKRVIPIIWNSQLSRNRPAARMMGEAKEFGLASGVSFSVHGRYGEAAMLSLSSSTHPRQAKQDIAEYLGRGQLLACYLHEAIQRLVLSKEALPLQKIGLTGREKECLLWASEGKTSGEIADILNLSERTVNFHFQNISQKMGVSTRQHAIARAISMGLVSI